MIFKQGVRLTADSHIVTLFALVAIDASFVEIAGHEAMITSADDATHGVGSLHPKGAAWDIRIWKNNDPEQGKHDDRTLRRLRAGLASRLGDLFDVVLESDHFHIEFDPKVRLVR